MESKTVYFRSIYSNRFQTVTRWIVLVVLWAVIVSIAIGKAGVTNLLALSKEKDVLFYTVEKLTDENQNLKNLIYSLKTSRRLQERYLKENFGYVEREEFVLRFNTNDLMEGSVNDKL